jgi:hypothetical protein
MSETVMSRPSRVPLLIVGAVVAILLGGTVALWGHYGSTVFFEMIRTGLATCFG